MLQENHRAQTIRSCSARHQKMMAKKGHLVLRMFENRLTSILLLQARDGTRAHIGNILRPYNGMYFYFKALDDTVSALFSFAGV